MTGSIGIAGRRALEMALNRLGSGSEHKTHMPDPAAVYSDTDLVQRAAAANQPPAAASDSGLPERPVDQPIKRVTPPPTVEEIAERVYRLFCQDLRRERERLGRWR